MHAVISCAKFTPRTLRIADMGDLEGKGDPVDFTKKVLQRMGPSECPICGSCSHVELSWHNMFVVHGVYDSFDEANDAAIALNSGSPGAFDFQEIVTA